MDTKSQNPRIVSVFLSDTHLGTRSCKVEFLYRFLLHIGTPTNIFLVGDIIDMWRLKAGSKWRQEHNVIAQQILKLSQTCNVFYISGNHDEYLREFENFSIGNIKVLEEVDYRTTTGNLIKIIHGDQYDLFMRDYKFLAKIGAWAYDRLVTINHYFNHIRRKLGYKYWSLAQYIKEKAKNKTNVVQSFETILVDTYRQQGYNGVICGHIHMPDIQEDDITYMNCGDWTENCTALIEYINGVFKLVAYRDSNLLVLKEWNQNKKSSL